MKYCPRTDYVLIRRVRLGQTPGGIYTPDASIEGVEHIVEAMGGEVNNLMVGDKVLLVGLLGQDYLFLPNSKDLLITKERNVVMIYDDVDDEK